MDRLKAIETFVVSGKAKSFADAASQLRIPRALVGRRIAQLEQYLKVRLFNRTTRELSLTPEGRHYLEACTRLLAQFFEEEELLSTMQASPIGELRVLAAGSFGRTQLLTVVAEFMKLYPTLEIEVELSPTPPTAIQLVQRGFDIGVRIYPPPANSRAIMKKVCNFDWIACASTAYLKSRGEPKSPADLEEHAIIIARGHEQWNFTRRGKPHPIAPKPSIRVSSGAVKPAILADLGIGLQPIYAIEDELRDDRIRPVLSNYSDPSGTVVAVYPHAKMLSAKVRLFTDFLAKKSGKRFEASSLPALCAR
jgi:DNA-binding transcriptional LysR family regulator